MHEALLGEAACPAHSVVLGLLLKPYSIGHDVRLARALNPLADSDKATSLQLSHAVLVCHQSWREFERMPWDPLIGLKFWLWRRRLKKLKLNFQVELAKFILYRTLGSREFPPSKINSGDSRNVRLAGCPFALRLQQFVMTQFNLKEHEAWDYPLGLAKCRWGCHWEENGDWSIYNEAEDNLFKYRDRRDAEKRAARAACEAKTKEPVRA